MKPEEFVIEHRVVITRMNGRPVEPFTLEPGVYTFKVVKPTEPVQKEGE